MARFSTTQSRCCPRWHSQSCPHLHCPGREVSEKMVVFELALLTLGEGKRAWEVEEEGQARLHLCLPWFPGEQGAASFFLSELRLPWSFWVGASWKTCNLVEIISMESFLRGLFIVNIQNLVYHRRPSLTKKNPPLFFGNLPQPFFAILIFKTI